MGEPRTNWKGVACDFSDQLVAMRKELEATRTFAAQARADERAKIVAWLRTAGGEGGMTWVDAANLIAELIERGEHEK